MILKKYDPKELRKLGIYFIIILFILNFFIVPLKRSIDDKKIIFKNWQEIYSQHIKNIKKTEKNSYQVLQYLFDKNMTIFEIQENILKCISQLTYEKDLEMLNFELLEPIRKNSITEIPIFIRFRGKPQKFIELLKFIENQKKLFIIKNLEITKRDKNLYFYITFSAFRLEK
ncbi:MAG: type 4a pilus biogenesis protein PilO [Candidatus Desulfofervidus auxilii]|nr:type 4a pilus biogenesis protein PilO [Candidatus Desulfofervidus auxilii]